MLKCASRCPNGKSETPELLAKDFSRLAKDFSRIGRGELPAHDEEMDLSERAKAGDGRARIRLVEKDLRLVVSARIGVTSNIRRLSANTTSARDRR
jgi:DNA-directed RNA polymerase sigma subunit (sigma70/sigma32)